MSLNDLNIIDPKSRKNFRNWLKTHHQQKDSVWITVYKTHTSLDLLRTNDVVEECLCFGWVDSRPRKHDQNSFYLLISPRRDKSVWSAVNKKKVSALIRQKLMTKHGLSKIEEAKKNGNWDALNLSDQLILPEALKTAFSQNEKAYEQFQKFSKSARRTILEWIYAGKSETTRSLRIKKTVAMSALGIKANLNQKIVKK